MVICVLLLGCSKDKVYCSHSKIMYNASLRLTLELFVERYFCFVTECKNPKACTILLRGPSKDILNEVVLILSHQ